MDRFNPLSSRWSFSQPTADWTEKVQIVSVRFRRGDPSHEELFQFNQWLSVSIRFRRGGPSHFSLDGVTSTALVVIRTGNQIERQRAGGFDSAAVKRPGCFSAFCNIALATAVKNFARRKGCSMLLPSSLV